RAPGRSRWTGPLRHPRRRAWIQCRPPPPRRGGPPVGDPYAWRTVLPLLLILFIAVPIAELYVIIQVGQWIGVLPTIGLLILSSILGGLLLRAQGRSAWRRFNAAVSEGRVPTREVLDGVCVIAGGLAMLAPGFI